MTAKHRRGKGNHKHEDNFFKNEVVESEVRGGVNNYALHLVLFLLIVIGGATGAWFCFQQHQSLTYLTDSLMGMQMKIVKLQSSHEEMRQSSREHVSESLESRLNALEDSYALAQKQVGMALATAEQLKTSDLPAQVLSLHTEMKARLAEMQQATVSLEQLSQLQTMLKGKSEEFEGVRIQVEGLAMLSAELSQKVEVLTGGMDEAESKLEEKVGQVATLSATLDGQAAEVLRLKEQLNIYQAQLDASTQEMATVRALLESEKSQEVPQASVEEQPVGQMEEEAAPAAIEEAAAATEEEEALPADVEQEVPISEEKAEADEGGEASEGEAAAQDEAPVEQEDAVTDETAPAEEAEAVEEDQTEQDESVVLSEETAEGVQGEEEPEEEPEEENQVADAEEESHKAEEEEEEEAAAEEEIVSEGEKGLGEEVVSEGEEEQQDVVAEEEAEETDEEREGHLENALLEDE
uniref:neurofilament light polypeptide isoform X2 n=1 Tax=Epinephelus lanceolatus TaxID=310571 RepID=UPI001448392B|nr:neurofilament light polypeptide isoform X2 [Epinephelus lanceolatus]